MGDFEKSLPVSLTRAALRSGDELVFPLTEAQEAIHIVTEKFIAILGVEIFRILEDGLQPTNHSGYEFTRDEAWAGFVRVNNDAALDFIEKHSFGGGYGYILTPTSERELAELKSRY
jgi:hypothetical protein